MFRFLTTLMLICLHSSIAVGLNRSPFSLFSSQTADSFDLNMIFFVTIMNPKIRNCNLLSQHHTRAHARSQDVSSVHRRLALNGSFESANCWLENSCKSDYSKTWMNRLVRFSNRLNRFIENDRFVHESYTASASRSKWCIIRSNDMFYDM